MNNYRSMINRITEIVCENSTENYILVGDNSSGKSEILRNIVEKKLEEAVYFIDSVNRTFDVGKVELVGRSYRNVSMDSTTVVRTRIDFFNFNLQDTFSAASCIEHLYNKYKEKLSNMCRTFLGTDLQIIRVNLEAGVPENKVLVDEKEVQLSSGYQAVLRLFCEILFFCDVMREKNWSAGMVVIDEIDEYLSPKYCSKIFNFIQEQFPNIHFMVTTHSLDLVECTKDVNVIVIEDSTYEIYSSHELETTVSADDIFTNLFFEERKVHTSDNDLTDAKLRRLLNLKIAGLWDEKAESELYELKNTEIQPHQKMICKQIEEW